MHDDGIDALALLIFVDIAFTKMRFNIRKSAFLNPKK